MTQNKEMPKELWVRHSMTPTFFQACSEDKSCLGGTKYIRADVVDSLYLVIDSQKQTIDNLLEGIATAEENSLVDVASDKTPDTEHKEVCVSPTIDNAAAIEALDRMEQKLDNIPMPIIGNCSPVRMALSIYMNKIRKALGG